MIRRKYLHLAIGLTVILIADVLCVDRIQYKEIGDKGFCLAEGVSGNKKSFLHYRESSKCMVMVPGSGLVKDVYWNDNFIIVLCDTSKSALDSLYGCIVEIDDSIIGESWFPYNIHKYSSSEELKYGCDSLGISTDNMNYTDSEIPFNLLHNLL